MVNSNKNSPDPSEPTEEITRNDAIIIPSETDSEDEENNAYNDYELLPMNDVVDDGTEEESEEENSQELAEQIPSIIPAEVSIVQELWNAPPPKSNDDIIQDEEIDEIKAIMSKITLSPNSMPNWAKTKALHEIDNEIMKMVRENMEKN